MRTKGSSTALVIISRVKGEQILSSYGTIRSASRKYDTNNIHRLLF
jgi:hypothetical protein